MKKQILSLLTALSISCAAITVPVFADSENSNVCTFDGFVNKTEGDSNDLKRNIPDGWSEINGYYQQNKDSKKDYYRTESYSKQGVLGKDADDTSYEIDTTWYGSSLIPASTEYQSRYNLNDQTIEGDYVDISYQMAYEEIWSNRWFAVEFKNADGAWGYTQHFFETRLNDDQNGVDFYVNGEKSDYSFIAKKWTDFNVVINKNTKTADLYVNGELLADSVPITFNVSGGDTNPDFEPATISNFQFGIYQQKRTAKGDYCPTKTYLDNVAYSFSDTEPEVTNETVFDFQDYAPADTQTPPTGFASSNADSLNNQASKAFLGKDADDICWRIETNNQCDDKAVNARYDLSTYKEFDSNSKYYHFSAEMFMEGAAMKHGFGANLYGTKTDSTSSTWIQVQLLTIEKDTYKQEQVVKSADGQEIEGLEIPMGVWLKYDAVIDISNKTYDLYINGNKVAEGLSLANDIASVSRIYNIYLYAGAVKESGNMWRGSYRTQDEVYTTAIQYYDNIAYGVSFKYPTIGAYEQPTVTDDNAVKGQVVQANDKLHAGYWVPLRGYDSRYYYYAENTKMPADGATRSYEATYGSNTTSNGSIFEVKNGKAYIGDKALKASIPTDKEFKLSFLFDVYKNTYNVYIDGKAIAADIVIDKNSDKNIEEFSSIEYYVTTGANSAEVNSVPVESGSYTKLPSFAEVDDGFITNYEDYTVRTKDNTVTANVVSNELNGTLILAEYDEDNCFVKMVTSSDNQKKISIEKADENNTVKFMIWSDLETLEPKIAAVTAE